MKHTSVDSYQLYLRCTAPRSQMNGPDSSVGGHGKTQHSLKRLQHYVIVAICPPSPVLVYPSHFVPKYFKDFQLSSLVHVEGPQYIAEKDRLLASIIIFFILFTSSLLYIAYRTCLAVI